MRINAKKTKGFSIGEVMVAVFILLVGVLDAVFLTVKSVDSLGNSRDSVVATLLAQEGVELVRNVRDNTVTETCGSDRCTSFDSVNGFPSGSGGTCTADYSLAGTGKLTCTGATAGNLYLNESTGLYGHDTGGSAIQIKGLKRNIYITYGNTASPASLENTYATVTSVVVFGGADFPSDITHIDTTCLKSKNCTYAQTHLTSWINYGE